MAEALLRFDALTSRWEYSTIAVDAWASTESINEVLVVARDSGGRLAGFVFDADPEVPEFGDALNFIEREFGDEVAGRVRQVPLADIELTMATAGTLAQRSSEEIDIMRPSPRLQSAASDVMISDDSVAGVVTVTMTVPWWARFARPWVTVRRRGKRDILLTGPLRVRGRTARATLRYGMPYPGSTLTADVVKGPASSWHRVFLAAFLAGLALIAAVVAAARVSDVELTETPAANWDVPTDGLIFDQVELVEGKNCLGYDDEFTVLGKGFDLSGRQPNLYLAVWDEFKEAIPKEKLIPVASRVATATEIAARAPAMADFPSPPRASDKVLVVLVADSNAPSIFGNVAVNWCGG